MDEVRRNRTADDNRFHVPIEVHHSLKGAVVFGLLVFVVAAAIMAMLVYLRNQGVYSSIPIALVVALVVIFLFLIHVVRHLFRDAGKVAIRIGDEGVKFDRYQLIGWKDIEKTYFVENSDGADCLWLKVKEGAEFLPEAPRPLIWLARKTGLHQSIDISGYGSLSMSDKEIHALLDLGIQEFGEPRRSEN